MNGYTIRGLAKADIDELLKLCEEHARYEQAHYQELRQRQDLVTHIFSIPARLYCQVVEEAGSSLVGYCTYMPEFSTWKAAHFIHMDCLFLKECARNKGLGKMMMEKIIDHAKELGIDEIQWQTPEDNTNAIRFYRKIGAASKNKIRFFLDPTTYTSDK